MKKTIVVIVSLGLLSVGFMFGTVVTNGKNQDVQQELELSHKEKIDSLMSLIEDNDYQIRSLKDECESKKEEIKFWGLMYDKCKGFK